jgi:hypothetical protein
MNPKVLSPIHLSGRDLGAAPLATRVALRGELCPAMGLGEGVGAGRTDRMTQVVANSVGSHTISLDGISSSRQDSWYRQVEGAQAGGNDRGP